MPSAERVMVFIDGSNFYHGLKAATGTNRIKFLEFAKYLCEGRTLVSIEYYNCPMLQELDPKKYADQHRFFSRLKTIPQLNLHLARLVKRFDVGKKSQVVVEKGLDVLLAVHLFKHAISDNYDTAILLSGDGDFAPAIEIIRKAYGKRVEIACFEDSRSDHLRQVSDKVWELEKHDLSAFTRP